MTTAAGYFDRKHSSSVRPGLSTVQQSSALPGSPHTPQRTISSTFSSPSASFRAEDDPLVFEFGTRHFSAGFAGESTPRCTIGFGPEDARHVGDYRPWQAEYKRRIGDRRVKESWGGDYGLWRMDLRAMDLGLVDYKIERAVREAYTKYLLIDQKPRRLMLVLPPVIPHPLLASVLTTLFTNYQYSSITLLSTPVLNAVAAGLRSALVIDIGWLETVVTGIYEYREVHHSRSTRAMMTTCWELSKMLRQELRNAGVVPSNSAVQEPLGIVHDTLGLEQCEEVMESMIWCRDYEQCNEHGTVKESRLSSLSVSDPLIFVPLSTPVSEEVLQIPISAFSEPVELSLFASNVAAGESDDQEQPLHLLAYQALLSLPPDVRGICMSRVVFTGGGSHIPGLKDRIVEELRAIIRVRAWDPVKGKAADLMREHLKEAKCNRQVSAGPRDAQKATQFTDEPEPARGPISAALADQEPDPIAEKLRREQAKLIKSQVSGVIRGIESLGAWAGGSLLAGLKIKGIVEIEKDRFIQYGLAGANRETEVSVVPQRQTSGTQRITSGDRSSWSLGAWS